MGRGEGLQSQTTAAGPSRPPAPHGRLLIAGSDVSAPVQVQSSYSAWWLLASQRGLHHAPGSAASSARGSPRCQRRLREGHVVLGHRPDAPRLGARRTQGRHGGVWIIPQLLWHRASDIHLPQLSSSFQKTPKPSLRNTDRQALRTRVGERRAAGTPVGKRAGPGSPFNNFQPLLRGGRVLARPTNSCASEALEPQASKATVFLLTRETKLNNQKWVPDSGLEASVMGKPSVCAPRAAKLAVDRTRSLSVPRSGMGPHVILLKLSSIRAAAHARARPVRAGRGSSGGAVPRAGAAGTEPVPRGPRPCLPVLSRRAPPTKTGTPTKGFTKATRAHLKVSSAFGKDPWATLEQRDASFDMAPPFPPPAHSRPPGDSGALHPPLASARYCWSPPRRACDNDRNHLPLGRGGHQA